MTALGSVTGTAFRLDITSSRLGKSPCPADSCFSIHGWTSVAKASNNVRISKPFIADCVRPPTMAPNTIWMSFSAVSAEKLSDFSSFVAKATCTAKEAQLCSFIADKSTVAASRTSGSSSTSAHKSDTRLAIACSSAVRSSSAVVCFSVVIGHLVGYCVSVNLRSLLRIFATIDHVRWNSQLLQRCYLIGLRLRSKPISYLCSPLRM